MLSAIVIRGLRVQHFCYPARTRNTGLLPVLKISTRPVPAGITGPVTTKPSQALYTVSQK